MWLRRIKVWGLLMLIVGGGWSIGHLRAGSTVSPLPRLEDQVVRAALEAGHRSDPSLCFEQWHVRLNKDGIDQA